MWQGATWRRHRVLAPCFWHSLLNLSKGNEQGSKSPNLTGERCPHLLTKGPDVDDSAKKCYHWAEWNHLVCPGPTRQALCPGLQRRKGQAPLVSPVPRFLHHCWQFPGITQKQSPFRVRKTEEGTSQWRLCTRTFKSSVRSYNSHGAKRNRKAKHTSLWLKGPSVSSSRCRHAESLCSSPDAREEGEKFKEEEKEEKDSSDNNKTKG